MCNTITDKLTNQLTEQVTISRKRKPGESWFLLHHLRLEHSTNLAKYGSQHMTQQAGPLFLQYDYEDSLEENNQVLGESANKVEQPVRDLLKGSLRLEGSRITAVKRGSSPVSTINLSPRSLSPETRITSVRKTSS